MKFLLRKILISVIAATVMLLITGCSSSDESKTIRIVHKNYTEQRLIGQMLSVYLENKGFHTEVSELGGTMLNFNAIKSGEADIYAEYTGTAYGAILNQTEILGKDETYAYAKEHLEEEFGITLLKPLGFNNTYVLSVTEETAQKYNLEKVSDLIPIAKDMIIGCDLEFADRTDGLPGLMESYAGLEFGDIATMDQGLTYQSLVNDEINVNVSYSTDGRIAKFGLINLVDDKSFFPPYYCVPILKNEFADANPEVVKALEELESQWTDEDMQKYNLMVDEGQDAKEVASLMLKDKGLIN